MNCFEFKRLALSDPYNENEEFRAHSAQCVSCATHLNNILVMDDNMRNVLSVAAPADLKARLKLRQVIEVEQRKNKTFRQFAYAASTFMAIGLAVFAYKNHQLTEVNDRYLALHQASIKHIAYEKNSLISVQDTAQTRMKAHLASLAGIDVNNLPGLRYSQLCPVLGEKTWHAVIEIDNGELVTVIFFNGINIPGKSLEHSGWRSQVMEGPHGDTLLIGKSKKALNSANEQIRSSISI